MITSFKNINQYYEVAVVDEIGDFVTGLTIQYTVYKSSDNSYITSGITSESDNVYYFNYTFTDNGEYRLKFITPIYYDNYFDTISVSDKYATSIDLSGVTINVAEIWGYSARTLTETSSGGTTPAEVWAYTVDGTTMSNYVKRIDTNTQNTDTNMTKIERYVRAIKEWLLTKFNVRM